MRHTRARRTLLWGAVSSLLIAGGCSAVGDRADDASDRGGGPQAPSATPSASLVASRPRASTPSLRGSRPNLLVVMTDDMRADDLRFMPATRRLLAERGLSFENSFSPNPLCCPARASLLTGQLTHNHGVYSHEEPWGYGAFDDSETLATALHRDGYRTALSGRYLNGYGIAPSKVTGAPSATYVPPGWDRWSSAVELALPASDPLAGNTYDYRDMTQNVDGRLVPHQGDYGTDVIGRDSVRQLRRFAHGDKPWFLHVTTVAPHHGMPVEPDDPDHVRDTKGHEYQLVTPAVPDDLRDRFDGLVRRAPGIPAGHDPEPRIGDKPRTITRLTPLDEEERKGVREVTRQRAEALYRLDSWMGRMITTMRRTGELRNTVVVFTSDNGYFLGEHRIRQGKTRPHEPSLRVPLLVAGPGIEPGTRTDPVTTVDLTATLLDLAGAKLRHPIDGSPFTRLLTGPDRGWIRPVPTEGTMGDVTRDPSVAADFGDPRDVIGVRTGRWKFVRYADSDRELYDLLRDPGELRNLAGQPRYARIERELSRVWDRLVDCRGRACTRPLPADLRTTPARDRVIDRQRLAASKSYYGASASIN